MKLDDEFFAGFYEKHVEGGQVAYMEKYLGNSGETMSALKSFEGRQYGLIIVDRRRYKRPTLLKAQVFRILV